MDKHYEIRHLRLYERLKLKRMGYNTTHLIFFDRDKNGNKIFLDTEDGQTLTVCRKKVKKNILNYKKIHSRQRVQS